MEGHFHLTEAAAFHYSFGRSLTAFKDMVPVSIGRRSFLSAALLAFAMTSQGRAQVGTAEAATGGSTASAAAYMRRVADDLMAAQRQGTVMSFHRVITRHANVEAIANYALGPYKSALSRSAYPSYYKGVAMFMARYFADSSREYAVGKTDIGQVTRRIPDSRCLGAWFFLELPAARHLPALHREERWQRQRACRGTEPVTFKTQSASIEQGQGTWR